MYISVYYRISRLGNALLLKRFIVHPLSVNRSHGCYNKENTE